MQGELYIHGLWMKNKKTTLHNVHALNMELITFFALIKANINI